MNDKKEINELVEHFFRHESGKMIAVLTGLFGTDHILLAEDLVQETLIEAIKSWTYKGIPENPEAWLYTVAKNKALNAIKREKLKKDILSKQIHENHMQDNGNQLDLFSENKIADDQLRMMFLCCHPVLSHDSQIALILKTICGFSIPEIAVAFFSNTASIHKRLVRARKKIRQESISFSIPKKNALNHRLDTVMEAIYLLFNEGYKASSGNELIRKELCNEAIRLAKLLILSPIILEKTDVHSLLALMQLNASRFNSRVGDKGVLLTLKEQDRSLWDLSLMEQGFVNLNKALEQGVFSKYHLMAGISAYHCTAKSFEITNWLGILKLYDQLLELDDSPLIYLNRAIALSEIGNHAKALRDLNSIEKDNSMQKNHLFHSVKAQLLLRNDQKGAAIEYLKKALNLAPLEIEKNLLEQQLQKIYSL